MVTLVSPVRRCSVACAPDEPCGRRRSPPEHTEPRPPPSRPSRAASTTQQCDESARAHRERSSALPCGVWPGAHFVCVAHLGHLLLVRALALSAVRSNLAVRLRLGLPQALLLGCANQRAERTAFPSRRRVKQQRARPRPAACTNDARKQAHLSWPRTRCAAPPSRLPARRDKARRGRCHPGCSGVAMMHPRAAAIERVDALLPGCLGRQTRGTSAAHTRACGRSLTRSF